MDQGTVSEATGSVDGETAPGTEATSGTGETTTRPTPCASCGAPLVSEYYQAGKAFVCPACREKILATRKFDLERFILACVFGGGAALVSAVAWWGIRTATGYEIGLVAVVVGAFVGMAVRRGSRGLGGRRIMMLAVFLTYSAVVMNYLPDVWAQAVGGGSEKTPAAGMASGVTSIHGKPPPPPEKKDEPPKKASAGMFLFALALMIGLTYAVPFLSLPENAMGVLIIGFALWEAWKLNRSVELSGPFRRVA